MLIKDTILTHNGTQIRDNHTFNNEWQYVLHGNMKRK